MKGAIDVGEISRTLAPKIIHGAHITTFEPDGVVDPVTDVVNPEVQRAFQQWLESELCSLLQGKAA